MNFDKDTIYYDAENGDWRFYSVGGLGAMEAWGSLAEAISDMPDTPVDGSEWLAMHFEYERCYLCHGDTDDHDLGVGPFGEPHAICKTPLVALHPFGEFDERPRATHMARRTDGSWIAVAEFELATWLDGSDPLPEPWSMTIAEFFDKGIEAPFKFMDLDGDMVKEQS